MAEFQPAPPETYTRVDALRREIADLFTVYDTTLDYPEKGYVRFRGRFLRPPAESFATLRRRFEIHGYTPSVTEEGESVSLIALPVVFGHTRQRWVINLLLYIATILSTLFVGAVYETGDVAFALRHLWLGFPFSFSVLLILTALTARETRFLFFE